MSADRSEDLREGDAASTTPDEARKPRRPPGTEAAWRHVARQARRNGFSIVIGFAGGPLVIYGDRIPDADCSNSELLTREQVAKLIGCHPDKLSLKRYRERMEAHGLVGKRLGGRRKMWKKADVISYIERMRRTRGRPRKLS